MSKTGKFINIKSSLPLPTKENPLIQIDWIFNERASLCNVEDSRENYRTACSFYKKFLQDTNNYNSELKPPFFFMIKKEWDKLALYKLKQWISATNIVGSSNYLTSNTIAGNISSVRQTMQYAYECGYISEPVIDVKAPVAIRETEIRSSFSNEEYEAIFKALAPEIRFSKNLLKPYQKTGLGRNPVILRRQGIKNGEALYFQGYACWKPNADGNGKIASDDNMRWYFENVMNCIPLPSTKENYKNHKLFFQSAFKFHGGIAALYKRWGVYHSIDSNVLMPLVVKLISETGLNVESALTLKRDCLKEAHPLTGLPYIEYYKPRSKGVKTLFLELYDRPEDKNVLPLRQKQSVVIASTINIILELTKPISELAYEKDKNILLIYQSGANKQFGKISRLTERAISNWIEYFVKNNDLRGRNGKRLVFTLSRFRPTKFTELVEKGHDLFHIMAIAGHASIKTTLAYIDRLKTTTDFQHTIKKALTDIKNNIEELRQKPLPVAAIGNAKPGDFIFKGPICHCKNPYDPPPQIKNNKNYIQGEPCTFFNMCLQCPKVLITEGDLPKLFAYRSEIKRALQNGVEEMPRQGELYKKTLSIIDEILTPDKSFTKEELDLAAKARFC